jgi:hypothetical protein
LSDETPFSSLKPTFTFKICIKILEKVYSKKVQCKLSSVKPTETNLLHLKAKSYGKNWIKRWG